MARPGLTGHRKFKRLTKALDSAIVARGVLELLWDHCYESGDDYVGTGEDIEAIVGWAGDSGALTRALANAGAPGSGFIDPVPEPDSVPGAASAVRFRVHDLWHHAPDYVRKRRERELKRLLKLDPASADRRAGDRRTAPNGSQRSEFSEILDWQDGDGRTPSPSPSPSPSPGKIKSVSSEPLAASEPAVLVFPTIGPEGAEWRLTETQLAEWRELFPGHDVLADARQALAWVRANQGNRKTASGMPRFLVKWFTRSVNSGRRPGSQVVPFTKTAGNVAAAGRFVARGQS